MSSAWLYSILSVIGVSLLSLVGLTVIAVPQAKLKQLMFLVVALATGSLFGDAFLDLLPESYKHPTTQAGLLVLFGILIFFVLERFLRWKHEHVVSSMKQHYKPVGYMNLVTDFIHNLMDGLIIGASYLAGLEIGLSTTLAIVFHEMGNFFVLLYAGFSKTKALVFNCLSGVGAIFGTLLALFIGSRMKSFAQEMLPLGGGRTCLYCGIRSFARAESRNESAQISLRALLRWYWE